MHGGTEGSGQLHKKVQPQPKIMSLFNVTRGGHEHWCAVYDLVLSFEGEISEEPI